MLNIMEQLHGTFAAYLHNTYVSELATTLDFYPSEHKSQCHEVLYEIIRHEDAVIDYVFDGYTSINDITPEQLKHFIRVRANTVLQDMNFDSIFMFPTVISSPITSWFYRGIKSIKVHDFFSASTTQYRKNWKLDNFSRLPHTKNNNE